MNLPSKEFLEAVADFVNGRNDEFCYYSFNLVSLKNVALPYYHVIVIDGKKYIFTSEEKVLEFTETVKTKSNLTDNQ